MGQWPRYRVRLDRRTGDGRLPGRFGSRRKVPSGNSRYRLYTWTSPFRPRFPSITNLVPTGKRLGRRSEQYAMTPSCNVATLTLQCIELVTRCMIAAVIHVIPRMNLPNQRPIVHRPTAVPPRVSRRRIRRDRSALRTRVCTGFSGRNGRAAQEYRDNGDIAAAMGEIARGARAAARVLALAPAEQKNRALELMAAAIRAQAAAIMDANAEDVAEARASGVTGAFLDRLSLDPARVEAMADGH